MDISKITPDFDDRKRAIVLDPVIKYANSLSIDVLNFRDTIKRNLVPMN